MSFTNYELVLLDNLIYLEKILEYKDGRRQDGDYSIESMINRLLSGDIDNCWKDELKEDQSDDNPGQCLLHAILVTITASIYYIAASLHKNGAKAQLI